MAGWGLGLGRVMYGSWELQNLVLLGSLHGHIWLLTGWQGHGSQHDKSMSIVGCFGVHGRLMAESRLVLDKFKAG